MWQDDFEVLADWALRTLDLRYKFIFASEPSDVMASAGILRALETATTLAIFEAHLAKGYVAGETVDFERAYPVKRKARGKKKSYNGKRCDLAFKERGKGGKWKYTEVKYYGGAGKTAVQNDIEKLRAITIKASRYLFVYRVHSTKHKKEVLQLSDRLLSNFSKDLIVERTRSFDTHLLDGTPALCEFCLCRVK